MEVPFWEFLEEVLCILSTVDAENHECHQVFYDPGVTVLSTGLLEATSPDLTLNGALYREQYQHGFKLGIDFILNYHVGHVGFLVPTVSHIAEAAENED